MLVAKLQLQLPCIVTTRKHGSKSRNSSQRPQSPADCLYSAESTEATDPSKTDCWAWLGALKPRSSSKCSTRACSKLCFDSKSCPARTCILSRALNVWCDHLLWHKFYRGFLQTSPICTQQKKSRQVSEVPTLCWSELAGTGEFQLAGAHSATLIHTCQRIVGANLDRHGRGAAGTTQTPAKSWNASTLMAGPRSFC